MLADLLDVCVCLWTQAHETMRRLQEAFPELREKGAIVLEIIKTQGDMILDRPLAEVLHGREKTLRWCE